MVTRRQHFYIPNSGCQGNRAFLEVLSVGCKLEVNVPGQIPKSLYLLICCLFCQFNFYFYQSKFDCSVVFQVFRICFIDTYISSCSDPVPCRLLQNVEQTSLGIPYVFGEYIFYIYQYMSVNPNILIHTFLTPFHLVNRKFFF